MSTAVDAPPMTTLTADAETPVAPPPDNAPAGSTQTLHAELERTRQTLATLTRERQITRELFALGAIDLDITGALLERDMAATPQAEIPALAAKLKERRPTLFRRPGGTDSVRPSDRSRAATHSTTMSPKPGAALETPEQLAASARATNSRARLLEYMRRTRQPAD